MKTVAFVIGTRPEVIKMAPLIVELRRSPVLTPLVIFSGQHRSMAEQAFSAFGLQADIELDLMQEDQTPNSFLAALLATLEPLLSGSDIGGLIVQGDTTTTLGGALTGFHSGLPVAHVEAGLRTHRYDCPFPEEMNRTLVADLSSLHFCPTQRAKQNLVDEGVSGDHYVVGNTVVDAIELIKERLSSGAVKVPKEVLALDNKRLILVTGHRRENFDEPLRNLCSVLRRLRDQEPNLEIVFPVHLNPRVKETVYHELNNEARFHLLPPVDYASLLWLIDKAELIISDSGGIVEEAPSFQTKVLITRDATERTEAIDAGTAVLTPLSSPEELLHEAVKSLSQPTAPSCASNPFGDGLASKRILEVLEQRWGR